MTRISLQLPRSMTARAKELAKRDGVSLDHLVSLALAEKMAALGAEEYIHTRAARASREKFDRALAKIPTGKPFKWDRFPRRKKADA